MSECRSADRRRRRVRRVLLLLVLWIGLASWPSLIYSGDPLTVQNTAINLWETGRLDVPEVTALDAGERGAFFYQNPRNGRWYNKYGIANTILALPAVVLQKWWSGGYRRDRVRLILLNIQNLLLSLALAFTLYELVSMFAERAWSAALWVLAVFYCTFAWNYLRAQNSEIWQWLFSAVFMLAALRWVRGRSRRWLAAAQLALAALVLVKTVYILWAAVLLAALPVCYGVRNWRSWLPQAIPLAAIGLVLLYSNYLRFGDPWASGYTQWSKEADYFSGSLTAGLWGFLTAPDKSVFLYFPPLIFALCSWPRFCKRWPRESVLIWGCALPLILTVSKVTNWGGHWAYGPRYLLTVLPLLSLPAAVGGEWLWERRRRVWPGAALGLILAVLGLSAWAQLQVNRDDFMMYYEVRDVLRDCGAGRAAEALGSPPFWLLSCRMHRWYEDGACPEFVTAACREVGPERAERMRFKLLRKVKPNLFFAQPRS